jgi:hypothetical protein
MVAYSNLCVSLVEILLCWKLIQASTRHAGDHTKKRILLALLFSLSLRSTQNSDSSVSPSSSCRRATCSCKRYSKSPSSPSVLAPLLSVGARAADPTLIPAEGKLGGAFIPILPGGDTAGPTVGPPATGGVFPVVTTAGATVDTPGTGGVLPVGTTGAAFIILKLESLFRFGPVGDTTQNRAFCVLFGS